MKVIAQRKFIRMSPRKLHLVADSIRGKDAQESLVKLAFMRKRAADPMMLVLKQAIGNAIDQGANTRLIISKVEVNEGPVMKRFQPVSRGMAHSIKKYTSHIYMEVSDARVARVAAPAVAATASARSQETKSTVESTPAPKATSTKKSAASAKKSTAKPAAKKTASTAKAKSTTATTSKAKKVAKKSEK